MGAHGAIFVAAVRKRAPVTDRRTLVYGVAAVIAVAAGFAATQIAGTTAVVVIIFALAGLALYAVERLVERSRADLFSPWIGYPVIYLLYFGVGWALPFNYVGGWVPARHWLYYLGGLAAYFVGLFIVGTPTHGTSEPIVMKPSSTVSEARLRSLAAWGLGLLAWFYSIVRFGLTSSNFEFRFTGAPGWLVFMLLLVGIGPLCLWLVELARGADRRRMTFLSLVVVGSSLLVFSFGSRSVVVTLLAMFLIALHYTVKHLRVRWLVALGLVAVLVISLAGYYRIYAGGRAEFLLTNNDYTGVPRVLGPVSPGLLAIRNGPGTLALIEEVYPAHEPYMYGKFSVMSVLTLLPGDQPLPGHVLTATLFGREIADMGGTAPSVLGGFYVDGGFIGILVGMLVTGMTLGLSYQAVRYRRTATSIAIYAALLSNYLLWLYGNFLTNPTILWVLFVLWAILAPATRPDISWPWSKNAPAPVEDPACA